MKLASIRMLLSSLFFISIVVFSASAKATITGDVTGGGTFSNNVETDNGWIIESAAGNGVDFWTLTANANDELSVDITSSIDFGISVYFGQVSDDLGFAFDNNGDFNSGSYIGGTNGDFGEAGSQLMNVSLVNAGIYTVAVGGDLGFGLSGPYNYSMDVAITPGVAVPVAPTLLLLLGALLSMFTLRRTY